MKFRFARNFVIFRRKVAKSSEKREIRLHSFCTVLYDKIDFPVKLNQVNKIEKQNGISINVFGYENKQTYLVYISKEKYENHTDLLLITEETKAHYVLIKNFERFMFHQTKHNEKEHFCIYCLQCFSSE